MKELSTFDEIFDFCKAVSSPLRMQIIQLLLDNGSMNLQDIAKALGVTNGALTSHIKHLTEAGLLTTTTETGQKGLQKICSLTDSKYIIDFAVKKPTTFSYDLNIPVGSFTDHNINPTCGLATAEHMIGYFDNPVYFDDPERFQAGLIWFASGYVEYSIPNYLQNDEVLTELRISQEICSQSPFARNAWPSDIEFSINGIPLLTWTSPTDFCMIRGLYTPEWWDEHSSQYGLLKTISITHDGTFLDNQKVSPVTLDSLNLEPRKPLKYRIASPETATHAGGCNLFGKTFGNYNQDICFSFYYEKMHR